MKDTDIKIPNEFFGQNLQKKSEYHHQILHIGNSLQLWTKYLRQTLVFVTKRALVLGRGLSTRL